MAHQHILLGYNISAIDFYFSFLSEITKYNHPPRKLNTGLRLQIRDPTHGPTCPVINNQMYCISMIIL